MFKVSGFYQKVHNFLLCRPTSALNHQLAISRTRHLALCVQNKGECMVKCNIIKILCIAKYCSSIVDMSVSLVTLKLNFEKLKTAIFF